MNITEQFRVAPIEHQDCVQWCLYKHYAHRMPSISFAYGLFDKEGEMVGVCTFGVPASPSLVKGAIGEEYKDNFLELNRLCVNDGLPKNALSFFVSQSLKMLPTPMVVVSYADSGQGHHGYIYQATNWVYTGITKPHLEYNGGGKHSRHLFDQYGGINEAKRQGVAMERGERSLKYRYFQFLGNKREKKAMLKSFRYPIIGDYPKGDNVRYDASFEVQVQGYLF